MSIQITLNSLEVEKLFSNLSKICCDAFYKIFLTVDLKMFFKFKHFLLRTFTKILLLKSIKKVPLNFI